MWQCRSNQSVGIQHINLVHTYILFKIQLNNQCKSMVRVLMRIINNRLSMVHIYTHGHGRNITHNYLAIDFLTSWRYVMYLVKTLTKLEVDVAFSFTYMLLFFADMLGYHFVGASTILLHTTHNAEMKYLLKSTKKRKSLFLLFPFYHISIHSTAKSKSFMYYCFWHKRVLWNPAAKI